MDTSCGTAGKIQKGWSSNLDTEKQEHSGSDFSYISWQTFTKLFTEQRYTSSGSNASWV